MKSTKLLIVIVLALSIANLYISYQMAVGLQNASDKAIASIDTLKNNPVFKTVSVLFGK